MIYWKYWWKNRSQHSSFQKYYKSIALLLLLCYILTIMTKVQLTLTDQEAALLAGYGSQLGYNVPKTAKFFIQKATEKILNQEIIPEYKMSVETEERGLQALAEHKAGKTTEVTDAKKFFEDL